MPPSLPTGPTRSTNEIIETMRSALLDFENVDGGSLKDFLGENLYRRAAPADTAFPYGTLRWSARRTPGYSGLRLTGGSSCNFMGGRPPGWEDINDAADLCGTGYARIRGTPPWVA